MCEQYDTLIKLLIRENNPFIRKGILELIMIENNKIIKKYLEIQNSIQLDDIINELDQKSDLDDKLIKLKFLHDKIINDRKNKLKQK